VPDAFYLPLGGDLYGSTKATAGPWSPDFQHGGPPCALLARAMERCDPAPGTLLSRFTAEFLGPVPVAELAVSARVARGGRRVQLVEAELTADGRPVLRARGWRLRQERPDSREGAPPPTPDEPPPALPAGTVVLVPGFVAGYGAAMEWRLAAGTTEAPGPATVWSRQRVTLVDGEQPSPVQRAVAVADSGSGASWELPIDDWTFINVDLTVHLVRPPEGEWICLAARTRVDPGGVGLATSALYDRRGQVGRGAQSLLIAPR
jgi:hypothetical protein